MYAGTVRFNILLGAIKPVSEVSQDELEAACRHANILDFIRSLPKYVCFLNLGFSSGFALAVVRVRVVSRLKWAGKGLSFRVVRNVCIIRFAIGPSS